MSKQLTLKRRRFIELYTDPENKNCFGNGAASVREAYPNIKTEKARGVMASKLIGNGSIREKIDKALEAKGITPELVMGKFQNIAENAKYDRDKISAWRNIGEMAGFMKKEPTVVVGQNQFNGDITETLERLRQHKPIECEQVEIKSENKDTEHLAYDKQQINPTPEINTTP